VIISLPSAHADIAVLTVDSISATQGVTNPANAFGTFNGTVATTGQYQGTGDTVTMTMQNFAVTGVLEAINFTIRMSAAGTWNDDSISIQYSNDSGTTWFNVPGAGGLQPPNTLTYYGNYTLIATTTSLNNTQIRLLYTRSGARDGITSSIDGIEMYVRYTPPDTAAPTVNLTWPPNSSWVTSASVAFNFTPIDNRGFLNCSLYIGGLFTSINQTPVINATNNTISAGGIADGNHLWNVSCMDTSNNTGTSGYSYTLRVDTTPPTVNLTWPANNSISDRTLNSFNFSVNDIAQVSACILVVDNVQKDSIASPQKGINLTLTASLTIGNHDWYVNCTDENGWIGQSETRNISVQITTPTIVPNATSYIQGENVSYSGSNWQDGAVVDIDMILPNGSVYTETALTNSSGNINATQSIGYGYPIGTYYVFAYQVNDTSLNDTAEFNVVARLVNITTDTDPYAQGEIVIITGLGFSPSTTVNLTISYLGGDNSTVIGADAEGMFTHPYSLSLSQPLGVHNITAVDRNFSNLNASTNFTVTERIARVRTNKTTYTNESVGIEGDYFAGFSTILFQIYNTITSRIGLSFPTSLSSDAAGSFNYTWHVNNTCSGNYTVLAQAEDDGTANSTFIIYHGLSQNLVRVPSTASGTPNSPTLSVVNQSDNTLHTIGLTTTTILSGYIEFGFTPNIPKNATFTDVTFTVEHRRTGVRADSYAIRVFNGTGYETATAPGCSGVPPDAETNQTCTITSIVKNSSMANDLLIRVNYTRTSQGGAGDIEIDFGRVNYSWIGDPIGCFEFGDTALPPYVSGVKVGPSTVVLNAGTTKTVLCNFTVTDGNGAADITGANITVFTSPSTSGSPLSNITKYHNSSCVGVDSGVNKKDYSCSVELLYYAVNGTWTCEATGISIDGISIASTTFNVDPLYALNVDSPLLDFGDLQTELPSSNITENITNYGNQEIDVTVFGYGSVPGDGLSFSCPSSSIPVGLTKFSWNTTAVYDEKINLTSSPIWTGISIMPQTNPLINRNSTYWQTYIPETSDTGQCTGTLVFEATAN
jgi:hypothetical protein